MTDHNNHMTTIVRVIEANAHKALTTNIKSSAVPEGCLVPVSSSISAPKDNTKFRSNHLTSSDWHHPASLPDSIPNTSPSRLIDEDPEEEKDVDLLLAEPEVAKPPMYAVVMYNDDYTPMEFVVFILQSEFRHTTDSAVEIMLNIHHKGRGIAGIYPKDIAETKARNANQTARKEGYPLLTQIEPHQE